MSQGQCIHHLFYKKSLSSFCRPLAIDTDEPRYCTLLTVLLLRADCGYAGGVLVVLGCRSFDAPTGRDSITEVTSLGKSDSAIDISGGAGASAREQKNPPSTMRATSLPMPSASKLSFAASAEIGVAVVAGADVQIGDQGETESTEQKMVRIKGLQRRCDLFCCRPRNASASPAPSLHVFGCGCTLWLKEGTTTDHFKQAAQSPLIALG